MYIINQMYRGRNKKGIIKEKARDSTTNNYYNIFNGNILGNMEGLAV